MQFLNSFKRLDMFSKVEESFESRTTSGGLFSIIVERHEFSVDNSLEHKFDINFDVVVKSDCSALRMDIVDRTGDINNVKSKIFKEKSDFRLLNTLSDTKKKLDGDQEHVHDIIKLSKKRRNFGKGFGSKSNDQHACRMYGTLTTNKVQLFYLIKFLIKGSFHITLVDQGFGSNLPGSPGTNGKAIFTNQYSVNQNSVDADFFNHVAGIHFLTLDRYLSFFTASNHFFIIIPKFTAGIFFTYDVEPILVKITEIKTPFSKFLIKMCSMIGGIFVTVGILLRVINTTSSKISKPESPNHSSILDQENPTKADLMTPDKLSNN
ncbi:Endoplasmic reticulum-Golgi intermediate compartment protein 2 [Smittium mucronatum]|uniref:Endoplasmic reticulum-Golgi intermediate compartment protein 2 n=1 Tax=Smittium mucronatum TaxID=133383 RepID=A0A1R0H160_9FUNG|nr:Endoplasmic reticulum-Golgi intermediate compartment protein 2 [Smittium mucronatum]